MASASARGLGASISVILAVAARRSGRPGPSAIHWSVTGAGRKASETSALRPGSGSGVASQGATASGGRPRRSSNRRVRYWG